MGINDKWWRLLIILSICLGLFGVILGGYSVYKLEFYQNFGKDKKSSGKYQKEYNYYDYYDDVVDMEKE